MDDILKEKGAKYLEQLGIYKPYIRSFRAKDRKVCFFEGFGGFWDYQEPEIMAKREQIEEGGEHIVYAITHERIQGEDMWSFLLASKDEEDLTPLGGNAFEAFAYVWNRDDDWCSEYGYINVKSFGGGISRIS